MTPTTWLVLFLSSALVLYVGAAGAYYFHDRPGMAITFIGYALGNVGLLWDALG